VAPTVALAVAAALLAPAPALARFDLTGATAQRLPIVLGHGDGGRVDRVTVDWTATCRGRSRAPLRGRSIAVLEPGEASADVLATTGRFAGRHGRRDRVSGTLRVRGVRDPGIKWTGTFAVTATVKRGRRVLRRCRTATTAWKVEAPVVESGAQPGLAAESWSVRVQGEPGESISEGQAFAFPRPGDQLMIEFEQGAVRLGMSGADSADSWEALFTTGDGRAFTARRYEVQSPPADNGPTMAVRGRERGCGDPAGSFTVEELGFTPGGRLKRLRIAFEQRCQGPSGPALRGTWEVTTTA
jgi:hypothetical protein